MAKSFYDLPPSWNPGYADPEYVRDEGLRRRAFTTAMAQRGTYDDPRVGSGGYSLPAYVKKEAYGQGAYVTKMAPRGTAAPVPNYLNQTFTKVAAEKPAPGGGVAYTFKALAGVESGSLGSAPSGIFGQFGARAAGVIISRVMKLPPAQRSAAMKAALDKMDPSLYSRAERYSKGLMERGVPARQALGRGLAAAISEGMLVELEKAGKSGRAPQANSLLGLGCYRGRSALGAVPTTQYAASSTMTFSSSGSGTCPPPSGYTWDAASGSWRRLRAGETPVGAPMVNGKCGGVTTQTGGQGGTTTEYAPTSGKMMELGPSPEEIWFSVPVEQRGASISTAPQSAFELARVPLALRPQTISQSAMAQIAAQMAKVSKTVGAIFNLAGDPKWVDGAKYGLPGLQLEQRVVDGTVPLFSFDHPEKGRRHGLYIKWEGTPDRPQWRVRWIDNEPSWAAKALGSVARLFARIANAVKDVVEAVADMACQLVNNPGAAGAAATASGPAAGVGVGIASGLCSKPEPPPPPPLISSSNTGMLLVAGAGALVLIAAMKKKRKA